MTDSQGEWLLCGALSSARDARDARYTTTKQLLRNAALCSALGCDGRRRARRRSHLLASIRARRRKVTTSVLIGARQRAETTSAHRDVASRRKGLTGVASSLLQPFRFSLSMLQPGLLRMRCAVRECEQQREESWVCGFWEA
jgi:hypothetical protein